MARRLVPFNPGQCFHVYNRGHNRELIFFADENYRHFLRKLRSFVMPHAEVIAYVLMPNHYHLLLQSTTDDLSGAMQRFGISYAKSINAWQRRVGSLFQGAFQAKLVDDESYLLNLSAYLHLNPVRAGLTPQPDGWEYSSYREFVGSRPGTLPRPKIALDLFDGGATSEEPREVTLQKRYALFVRNYSQDDRQKIRRYLI